ncbi:hypothetical protein AB0D08_24930 [Kitasatospora sp. NPDC048540]|uniref:hypothetical protein n=1 Tax=Kitasatospora sp. NPDC048540 TaxID=3155634 RepID=UPI0033DDD64F
MPRPGRTGTPGRPSTSPGRDPSAELCAVLPTRRARPGPGRPELRRPEDTFAGPRIGRPHLLINRIALGSYLLFVLARFLAL